MEYTAQYPLKVITLFSGMETQCMALDRVKEMLLGFDYDLVAWCENDPFAIQAHNAVYPQYSERNLGDITKVKWEECPACDLLTYSWPCTNISSAGKEAGFAEGSGTASSLLWEALKGIEVLKPKFLLMENVKALTFKKNMPGFQALQDRLAAIGYKNYWKVVNATQFDIPQNRERVFMVSILGDWKPYKFPTPKPLTHCLGDVLEENAPESYFLSDQNVAAIIKHCERKVAEGCGFDTNFTPPSGISGTIKTREGYREYDTYVIIENPVNDG